MIWPFPDSANTPLITALFPSVPPDVKITCSGRQLRAAATDLPGLVYQTTRSTSMGVKGQCVPGDFLECTLHGFSDFLRNRRGGVMVEIGVSRIELHRFLLRRCPARTDVSSTPCGVSPLETGNGPIPLPSSEHCGHKQG